MDMEVPVAADTSLKCGTVPTAEGPAVVDLSEFAAGRAVHFADEHHIVYDDPLPPLEQEWNALAEHYAREAEARRSDAGTAENFFRAVAAAAAENSAGGLLSDLVAQGRVRTLPMEPQPAPTLSIRPHIAEEVCGVLARGRAALAMAIEEEERITAEFATRSLRVIFENGALSVHTPHGEPVTYPPAQAAVAPCGLLCTIKYRSLCLRGAYIKEALTGCAALAEQHCVQSLVQTFTRGELRIDIACCDAGKEAPDEAHPVCRAVIEALREGIPLSEQVESIFAVLSLEILEASLGDAPVLRVVDATEELLADERGRVFFVRVPDAVYRVERSANYCEVLKNGVPVII